MLQPRITFTAQLFCLLILIYNINSALANNSIYINLSNNIAKKQQLKLISNNIANTRTPGYEADEAVIGSYQQRENSKKINDFAVLKGSFINHEQLATHVTNRSLDIAVKGGYLKVMTTQGPRYTLNGNIQVNEQGVLVHNLGYPYLTMDNSSISLADTNPQEVFIDSQGIVLSDAGPLGQLGIFTFSHKFALVKEGNGLYYAKEEEIPAEHFVVTSRSLALSNVNGDKSMKDLMDLQQSMNATTQMIRLISKLERDTIRRLTNN